MANATKQAEIVYNKLKLPIIIYSILVGIYFAFIKKNYSWNLYSWHPFCFSIGAVACTANSILIKKVGGYQNTKMHGTLMTVALLFILGGWYAIHTNKNLLGKQHWKSSHGYSGLLAILIYIGIGIFGSVTLNPDFGILKNNKTIRAAHKYAGKFATAFMWYVFATGVLKMEIILWKRIIILAPLLFISFFTLL